MGMNAVDVHVHVAVPEILRDAAPNESRRPQAAVIATGEFAGVEVTASLGGVSIGDPRFCEHYLWNLAGNAARKLRTATTRSEEPADGRRPR